MQNLSKTAKSQVSKQSQSDQAPASAPSEKKSKPSQKRVRGRLSILMLIISLCILVLQFFILANQQGLHNNQKLLQQHIERQAGMLKTSLSELLESQGQTFKDSLTTQLAALEKLSLNNHTETTATLQQLKMQQTQLQKKLQILKGSIEAHNMPQQTTMQTSVAKLPTKMSDQEVTHQYRIYAVNDYGLVLQDESGNFMIANIGRELGSLGTIRKITADKVIVGKYQIVADPKGFQLKQLKG